MNGLDTIRRRLDQAKTENTEDGLVHVLYDGKSGSGIRLVVNMETKRAIASDGENRYVVQHGDLALAASRALSRLCAGGIA